MAKATGLDPGLHEYLMAHRTPDDAVLESLRDETRQKLGGGPAPSVKVALRPHLLRHRRLLPFRSS